MSFFHIVHNRHRTNEHDERKKTIDVKGRIMEIVDCDKDEYEERLKTDAYIHNGKKYTATGPEVFEDTYYMPLASQGADLILKLRNEHRARGYTRN